MGITTDDVWRERLIFFSMLLMLTGLFVSRTLLSCAFFLFVICTCVHKDFLSQLRRFATSPLLVAMSLLFFIPFVSWFWSDDKLEWMRWIRVKLPLFLFPLAFAGSWQICQRQWCIVLLCFLALVFAGSCWSLWHYVQDMKAIHQSYLKARLLDTPLANDHVRFSLSVCLALILGVFLIREMRGKAKWLLGLVLVFLTVYLHVLSARTGLAGFYLFIFAGCIYLLWRLRKPKWVVLAASVCVLLPLASWFLLPTFQNRIRYMLYDLSYTRKDAYLPGGNDGNRILSLRAGWQILKEHPGGVGSGDVLQKSKEWYGQHAPSMNSSDMIYPSSEWLLYGDTAGWFGFLLFTAIMVIQIFERKIQHRFFWIVLSLILAFSFLFDVGLETQFGVFIYAFVLLCFWKKNGFEQSRTFA